MVDDYLRACELHDVEGLRAVLGRGLDPNAPIQGKTPARWLIEMYTRSDAFSACLRVLLDAGAHVEPESALPVLLNDASAIEAAVRHDRSWLERRVTLPCTFTPLDGATWLHLAAELGHAAAVRVLLDLGADPNAAAGLDADGLGGHTPVFHTVNSNRHRAAPVLALLLDAGARVDVRVAGLTWGRGFEWESTFFDLTPIAYAQLGLLPQMHRDPRDIDATVRALLAAAGRPVPAMPNVPNRYVHPGTTRAGL